MNLMTKTSKIYSLLDSGEGQRLEKFGNNILLRPDNICLWHSSGLIKSEKIKLLAQAVYFKQWELNSNLINPWHFEFEINRLNLQIKLALRLGPSKNIGVFPEQQANWVWIAEKLKNKPKAKILNLFGYTGGASLIAAASGAEVCHVDASKAVITWARENQNLSGLSHAPIRWIEDDCLSFMRREIKRGVKYDAIIMDPPAFGRDPKGNTFSFQEQIHDLLKAARNLLSDEPIFLLVNGYAMGYPAEVLGNLVREYFSEKMTCGELQIEQEIKQENLIHKNSAYVLSCGVYVHVEFDS